MWVIGLLQLESINMKHDFDKEWCENMARLEIDHDIAAGVPKVDAEQEWSGRCKECGITFTKQRKDMKNIIAGQLPGELPSSWEAVPCCYMGSSISSCAILMYPKVRHSILATAVVAASKVDYEDAVDIPKAVDTSQKFYDWLHSDAIEVRRGIDVIPMPEEIDCTKEPFDGKPILLYIEDETLGTGWIECVWRYTESTSYWFATATGHCLNHCFKHYLPINAKE